jgi:hypothetical protein
VLALALSLSNAPFDSGLHLFRQVITGARQTVRSP